MPPAGYTAYAVNVTGIITDLNGTVLTGKMKISLKDNILFTDSDGRIHAFNQTVEEYNVVGGAIDFWVEASDYTNPRYIAYVGDFTNAATNQTTRIFSTPILWSLYPVNIKDILYNYQISEVTDNVVLYDLTTIMNSAVIWNSANTGNATNYTLTEAEKTLVLVDTVAAPGGVTVRIDTSRMILGKTIVVKDFTGSANTKNITVTNVVGQTALTFDGDPSVTINSNYGVVRLIPVSSTALIKI